MVLCHSSHRGTPGSSEDRSLPFPAVLVSPGALGSLKSGRCCSGHRCCHRAAVQGPLNTEEGEGPASGSAGLCFPAGSRWRFPCLPHCLSLGQPTKRGGEIQPASVVQSLGSYHISGGGAPGRKEGSPTTRTKSSEASDSCAEKQTKTKQKQKQSHNPNSKTKTKTKNPPITQTTPVIEINDILM